MVKLHKFGKYQHYKGGIYEVLGVAEPLEDKRPSNNLLTIAIHSEREANFKVPVYIDNGKWFVEEAESHVIYKDETDKIWARPHDMFMDYVEVEDLFGCPCCGNSTKKIRRFEYIGN